MFFNPGTPTDLRFSSKRSVGILETDSEIRGRIIEL
ncbi:MAG: metallophosphatase family protein [Bacteroidetes bacterium]|nr:metallophosphatase family protein [Bacteroidota bacterium]